MKKFVLALINAVRHLYCRLFLTCLGLSDLKIRQAYSFIVCHPMFDNQDQYEVGMYRVWVIGTLLRIQNDLSLLDVAINEVNLNAIRVEEWRKQTREVLVGGKPHDTHWYPIYESGRKILNVRFASDLELVAKAVKEGNFVKL